MAVGRVENPVTRSKLFILNSLRRIEPTEEAKKAVSNVTVEAIESAMIKHASNQWEDMELYDNEYMCESLIKAGGRLAPSRNPSME